MTTQLFVLRGVTLGLAWFLVLNALASVVVVRLMGRLVRRGASRSPRFWFAVRIFPAALSAAFVAVLFIPSYVAYEPRGSVEGFDLTLVAFAIGGLALCLTATIRGLFAWRAAARRTTAWMATARPLVFAGSRLPAFEIDAEAPVMALAGILRPRLIITRGLMNALTDEELGASVAHEIGHSHAWDNLKRLAIRSAPDFLGATPAARVVERRWAAAAERSADCHAARRGAAVRCALASALVKVARLLPPTQPASSERWTREGPAATGLMSALVSGGDMAARIEALLDDPSPWRPGRRWRRPAAWAFAVGSLAAYAPLLRLVHATTELLVRSLP